MAQLLIDDGSTLTLSVWQIKGVKRMQQAGNVLADPRPDLRGDSWLWERLLPWSYGADGLEAESLFGAVSGFRSGGARLEFDGQAVRFVPGDWPAEEYRALRDRYLLPHAARLNKLLVQLGAWAYERAIVEADREKVRLEALL